MGRREILFCVLLLLRGLLTEGKRAVVKGRGMMAIRLPLAANLGGALQTGTENVLRLYD